VLAAIGDPARGTYPFPLVEHLLRDCGKPRRQIHR
jgi:hypothetical protein